MKLNLAKHEADALLLIKAHTGCEAHAAVALLADLQHLETKLQEREGTRKMSVNASGTTEDADKLVNQKKRFFF